MRIINYMLIILVYTILCRYIWEYVDPWIGIVAIVVGIYALIYKTLKNKKEDEKMD